MGESLWLAIDLVLTGDTRLVSIVALSAYVSLTATVIACALGFPLGAFFAVAQFPGRRACLTVLNALMGLPPVVVGLMVYMALSRSGPAGFLGLLYTPTAMIIAQCLLILPLIAALTRQIIEDAHREYDETLRTLGVSSVQAVSTLLYETRLALVTVALAGLGRALAEVGAVMIVGGNIDHVTRVMTTAITLETSRGDLALALALGMVLLAMSLLINAAVTSVRATQSDRSHV
ncbi:MAG: ABC transporter permease [Pseudomonadota bacterium]